MNQRPSDILFDAAASLAADRAQVEFDLVGAIVARPAEGAAVANAAGLRIEDFDADDLRVILNALRVKISFKRLTGDRDADQLSVAMLARDGLRMYGFWDPAQIAGNVGSSQWSDQSLAALFESQLHHPVLIQRLIRKLHRIEHRQREAAEAYARCRDLLEGDADEIKPPKSLATVAA